MWLANVTERGGPGRSQHPPTAAFSSMGMIFEGAELHSLKQRLVQIDSKYCKEARQTIFLYLAVLWNGRNDTAMLSPFLTPLRIKAQGYWSAIKIDEMIISLSARCCYC